MMIDDLRDSKEILWQLRLADLKKEHDRNLGSGFYKHGYMDGFDDAIKAIDSVPPADVVPVRRGTWGIIDPFDDHEIVKCSECGYVMERETPYCPHCGAKMEGKTNDND